MLSKCPNCRVSQRFFNLLFARRRSPIKCHGCGLILACDFIYFVCYALFFITFIILFAAYSEYLSVTLNRILLGLCLGVFIFMTFFAPLTVKKEI